MVVSRQFLPHHRRLGLKDRGNALKHARLSENISCRDMPQTQKKNLAKALPFLASRLPQNVRSGEKHLNEGNHKKFLFPMKQRKRVGSRRPAFTRSCIFPRTGDSRSRLRKSSFLGTELFFWGGRSMKVRRSVPWPEGCAARCQAGRVRFGRAPFAIGERPARGRWTPSSLQSAPHRSCPLLLTPAHACRGPEK